MPVGVAKAGMDRRSGDVDTQAQTSQAALVFHVKNKSARNRNEGLVIGSWRPLGEAGWQKGGRWQKGGGRKVAGTETKDSRDPAG
jgi:hypothetical protein